MSNMLQHFRKSFAATYDGEPWYGKSLIKLWEEVPIEKAFRRPAESSHSIVEVLLHILAWRAFFLKRLRGENPPRFDFDSPDDWPPQPDEHTIEYWEQLRKKFDQNQAETLAELDKLKPEDLDADFAGSGVPLSIHLDGAIQHDVYHIGQIALLNKL